MPHATDKLTNGETTASKFINHVTSYPVVHDGIETYKNNSYGKKSLELANGTYDRFGKPVEPYLEKPYTYAKPYLQKADELADSGLTKFDGYVPIVKEDTHTIVDTAKGYAFWPYNYLTSTWQDQYEKTKKGGDRGDGIFTLVQALISTELKIVLDTVQVISDFVGPKYEDSKKKGSNYVNDLKNNADHYKQVGADKVNEYTKAGQEKAQEAQKVGEQKAGEAKDEAKKAKEDVKQKAQK